MTTQQKIRWTVVILTTLVAVTPAWAQMGSAGSGSIGSSPLGQGPVRNPHAPFPGRDQEDPAALSSAAREQIEKGRQSDRQRRMVADTNRLLALSAELKASYEKSGEPTSAINSKKAEEIEKLAHTVKERMKG